MKNVKRLTSLLLVMVMVFAMSVTAFAEGDGKITINNVKENTTYTIYRIFELESYVDDNNPDTTDDPYAYKVSSKWSAFFETGGKGLNYVNIDSQGYVTWKTEADTAQFAADAIAYAKEIPVIENDGQKKVNTGETSVEFTNLDLGYYLVDSTIGSLCALTTTNPTAVIVDKSKAPTITKEVKEGEEWKTSNDAQIGKPVEFKVTITVKEGAENYVLHDVLGTGFTFDNNIEIKNESTVVEAKYYTIKTSELDDTCTFHIEFKNEYIKGLKAGTKLEITYSATLNENALIYDEETGVNKNKAWLTYGDNEKTNEPGTETKTFKFELVKTDDKKQLLSGAKFELYDAATGGNKISVVKLDDGTYRVAVEGENGVQIEAGRVVIKGLDRGNYWLEETVAPNGYNKLAERHEVKIEDGNKMATMNNDVYAEGGVQVENKAGTILPSTGGMGTTFIYTLGAILVLSSAVILVSKKRAA